MTAEQKMRKAVGNKVEALAVEQSATVVMVKVRLYGMLGTYAHGPQVL
jgi:hypothetical protein